MPRRVTFGSFVQERFAALGEAWSQIWFQPKPTSPLELARMGIGAALLLHYGLATPYLFDFWGDAGLMPRAVVLRDLADPWTQSVFFYFRRPGSGSPFTSFSWSAALPSWSGGGHRGSNGSC